MPILIFLNKRLYPFGSFHFHPLPPLGTSPVDCEELSACSVFLHALFGKKIRQLEYFHQVHERSYLSEHINQHKVIRKTYLHSCQVEQSIQSYLPDISGPLRELSWTKQFQFYPLFSMYQGHCNQTILLNYIHSTILQQCFILYTTLRSITYTYLLKWWKID